MKKILFVFFGLIGLVIILFVGYMIGSNIGQTTGAQQYTKKMWMNDESQISTYNIFQKINDLRVKGNLQPFAMDNNLCKVAYTRAKSIFDKATGTWFQEKQQYNQDQQNVPESKDVIVQMIRTTCPTCDITTYNEANYTSLRPETCWNYAGKQVCEGDESYGILEKYVERIVKLWSEDSNLKQVIYSPIKYGCVEAYGGSVQLSISQIK